MSNLGEWRDQQPEEILPRLKQISKSRWLSEIRKALKADDIQEQGKAVIALALWHRAAEAPFNSAEYQREFWKSIRHRLASDKPETAVQQGAFLAPLSLILCSNKSPIKPLIALIDKSIDQANLLVDALGVLAKIDLLKAVEQSQRYLAHPDPLVRGLAVDILGKTRVSENIPMLQKILHSDEDAGVVEVAAIALSQMDVDTSDILEEVIRNGSVNAAMAAVRILTKPPKSISNDFLEAVIAARTNDVRLVKYLKSKLNDIKPTIDDPSPREPEPREIRQPIDPSEAYVLVVEDNVPNFVLISRMLAFMGVQRCEWKTSGWQVIKFAETLPRIDLIFLDINLPYEDGFQALPKIRAHPHFKEVFICAVTAFNTEEHMQRAQQAGFDGFLGKPLNAERFPDQVRRLLSGEPVWEWK